MNNPRPSITTFSNALSRKLILVSGKGGVGKTTLATACALSLARARKRTLIISFDDPMKAKGEILPIRANLFSLNCVADRAFEEYIAMKIRIPLLAKLFVRNPLMRYLANAGPGIHELVILGKVWHERLNFDHVVVDMPSTGFGLAMFESTRNFARLFREGNVRADAEQMLATFGSPRETAHIIVALPEEMPLREGLELDEWMGSQFPDSRPCFVVNGVFPQLKRAVAPSDSLIPQSPTDAIAHRNRLEQENLKIWEGMPYTQFPLLQQSTDLPEQLSKLVDPILIEGAS